VDAKNVRNIVLMRPVNSMIEFKQIIGRGTRTFQGKDYFMIYDFLKAHERLDDPEWDGDPADVIVNPPGEPRPPMSPGEPGEPNPPTGEDEPPPPPPPMIEIELANGRIISMAATTF
jgi:type I restriction enzyme R subunit